MTELHEVLAERVAAWRAQGYPTTTSPAVGEILQFAVEGEEAGAPFPQSGMLRFLRAPQLRALETYWYLRVVERTPHVAALYARLFPDGAERLEALGLGAETYLKLAVTSGVDGLIERIRTDDEFAREQRLEALRETLALDYPSYILALAMGAGKTILIGAVIATEFALAIEYPDGGFIENALVFAPGTTIIESLRELGRTPYEKILPPRLHEPFAAALKMTFTRDGERDIPVTRGSSFNLVVTNTEKIRIQARPVRRKAGYLQLRALEEEAREVANLRLQAIASLPHLGIFSDEAHHTYGQSLGTELKRVRQTVDYLAEQTNVVCVVNTTGTPYFERQPLRDVVVWYGLGQGIRDGILKEVAGNIQSFTFAPEQADEFVAHVVGDFFTDYGDVTIADGSPARLAIYFPQVDDLRELRPHVELALSRAGLPTTAVLENTNASTQAEIDAFNRLNDPTSPHRVILLVNKGTEGWNCPSLFATALARKLRTANNFVLQAAGRCLRQVPGNTRPARIYLSDANRGILDRQLRETYGESLDQLNARRRRTATAVITLRKTDIDPIPLRRKRRVLVREEPPSTTLAFTPPAIAAGTAAVSVFDVGIAAASRRVLRQVGDTVALEIGIDTVDAYAAAQSLAANYRADQWAVLDAIKTAYPDGSVPVAHLNDLARQLEQQRGEYRQEETEEDVLLEIVKPEGWEERPIDGVLVRVADISYPIDKQHLVIGPEQIADNAASYGFHYAPYNFDSNPEADFFEKVLRLLNMRPADVQDVFFTGAVTDPAKTDLTFAYRDAEGRIRHYTPDFVVRARDGRWLLVEIKMTARRKDAVEGQAGLKAKALEALAAQNSDLLSYRMVFADTEVDPRDITLMRDFLTTS
ncbi:MAG: DEAD/DEAH box helicase family protein [Chloroflexota bacterium]